MPKQTRKLLVYLDQNFLSAMAKADGDEKISPAFTEIYLCSAESPSEPKPQSRNIL